MKEQHSGQSSEVILATSSLIRSFLGATTREILAPPTTLFPDPDQENTLGVGCWSLGAARALVGKSNQICQDEFLMSRYQWIEVFVCLGVSGVDRRIPYCRFPINLGVKQVSTVTESQEQNWLDYPILTLQDVSAELIKLEEEGLSATVVAFGDGHFLAGNAHYQRMSGITLSQRSRLSSYYPWHLPGEIGRFAQAVLDGGGNYVDHSYKSRKISDYRVYEYAVKARAFRVWGYDGELYRLSHQTEEPRLIS